MFLYSFQYVTKEFFKSTGSVNLSLFLLGMGFAKIRFSFSVLLVRKIENSAKDFLAFALVSNKAGG
ncbi:hypothetical protein DRQ12_09135 [candidate division KSB1 bacterium]|nr:MAG: hypothetical protein DRQ12_09135 [candidate division KSB1 bacterium]